MNIEDPTYTKALAYTIPFNQPPEGISRYTSASKSETTIIRQNNTIIVILLEINSKLDQLLKKEEKIIPPPNQTEIEELINKIYIYIYRQHEYEYDKVIRWISFSVYMLVYYFCM